MHMPELRKEWQRHFGSPPKNRAAGLMCRVMAWQIKTEDYYILDAATRLLLAKEENEVCLSAQLGIWLASELAGIRH